MKLIGISIGGEAITPTTFYEKLKEKTKNLEFKETNLCTAKHELYDFIKDDYDLSKFEFYIYLARNYEKFRGKSKEGLFGYYLTIKK